MRLESLAGHGETRRRATLNLLSVLWDQHPDVAFFTLVDSISDEIERVGDHGASGPEMTDAVTLTALSRLIWAGEL